MTAALEQAALGLAEGEIPIGSVVAADGEIVARAHWRSGDGLLAHPELVALQQANRRDVTLVTTLEPCLLCMAAAMFQFAERIVYALESPTDGGRTSARCGIPPAGRSRRTAFLRSRRACAAPSLGSSCRSSSRAFRSRRSRAGRGPSSKAPTRARSRRSTRGR